MDSWSEFYDNASKEEVVEMLAVNFARAENYRELLGRIGLSFCYGRDKLEREDLKELIEAAADWILITGRTPKQVERQEKVEPEIRINKWILSPTLDYFNCPQCKEPFSTDKYKSSEMRYCPKCGAKNHYYPWEA